jgi:hypothetical protein
MNKQNITIGIAVILIICSLSACAPAGYTNSEAGFFSGILYGFVFFFALIGKLFGADVGLYAEHNTGFFYWLGFIFGLGGLGGGANSSRR